MRFIDKENTPHEWTSQRISHYVEEHKGGAPLRPSDFSESGFPVIPKKAIQQGNKLVISKPTFCTKSFADKNTRSIVDTNYTITTLRDLVPTGPTIGTVVNFYSDEQYILSQGVYGLKLKSNIDRDYFAYVSNAAFYRKVMKRVMVGSTQVHIRTPEYLSLEIQLPPLPEQRKIATILGTWDKAISTTERLIDNSKQQKKALMQQLLTGKKRLLDDSGKPFEGEWEEVKLKSIAEMNSGGTPKSSIPEYYGGDIPWVSIADMTKHGKWISKTEKYLTQEGLNNSSARLYPKGTILYAMYASIGECSIAEVELSSSQAILGIRPTDKLSNDYLYYFLTNLKSKITLMGQQGTQSNLNAGMVKDFRINLPPKTEQLKIASVLTNADKEIDVLEHQLADLKQEKKALMQQLLTGKRRVKVDDKEVA